MYLIIALLHIYLLSHSRGHHMEIFPASRVLSSDHTHVELKQK